MGTWACCDACGKWRLLGDVSEGTLPEKWFCCAVPDDAPDAAPLERPTSADAAADADQEDGGGDEDEDEEFDLEGMKRKVAEMERGAQQLSDRQNQVESVAAVGVPMAGPSTPLPAAAALGAATAAAAAAVGSGSWMSVATPPRKRRRVGSSSSPDEGDNAPRTQLSQAQPKAKAQAAPDAETAAIEEIFRTVARLQPQALACIRGGDAAAAQSVHLCKAMAALQSRLLRPLSSSCGGGSSSASPPGPPGRLVGPHCRQRANGAQGPQAQPQVAEMDRDTGALLGVAAPLLPPAVRLLQRAWRSLLSLVPARLMMKKFDTLQGRRLTTARTDWQRHLRDVVGLRSASADLASRMPQLKELLVWPVRCCLLPARGGGAVRAGTL